MAKAKETELDPTVVPNKDAADLVSEEMVEAAEESAKARNLKKAEEPRTGTGTLRRQGGKGAGSELVASDVPYPTEVHGEDFEFYGPMGAASSIPEGTEIAAYASEQEFVIDPEKVKVLYFQKAGRNLPKKRLYNIKGIHKDGRLVQLPFEAQVQNNAGGDPEDAIGLRRYQRKGIHLLVDFETLIPVYCAAWDCWAKAAEGGNFAGFCSLRHAQHTLPNQYKGASEISKGLMEAGVTTTAIWSS